MRRILVVVAVLVILCAGLFVSYYFAFILPRNQAAQESTFLASPEKSTYITEYSLGPASSPNAITLDSQGNVWFGIQNSTAIGELTPANGTVHEYQLPEHSGLTIWGIIYDSQTRSVWFTDFNSNSVWRFDTASHVFRQFPMSSPSSFPYRLVLDNHSNVWFTELFSAKIGEIETNGTVREFAVPPVNGNNQTTPSDIAIDPEGRIWFSEPEVNAISSFSNGEFTTYDLNGSIESPVGIALDPQGNIWLTEHGPSYIAEFNPQSRSLRTFSTSIPPYGTSLPYWIALDQQGNVWFDEHGGNAIAMFEPGNGSLKEFEIPTRPAFSGNLSGAISFALSPAGVPWFTELFSGKIGTVNTSVPLNTSIRVNGSISGTLMLNSSSGVALNVGVISTNASSQSELALSIGNYTNGFTFSFSPKTLSGENSSSILLLSDKNAVAGVYYVTISAESSELRISQLIEIQVGP